MSWIEREFSEEALRALQAAGVDRLMARLLAVRGVTPETLGFYFDPSLANLESPENLPGISEAAQAILDAVRAGRKIVVFGDYDCDGISATAIMVRTLKALQASVVAFLPDRMLEGYGMTALSLRRLLAEHPDTALVVTVDNGINSVEEVECLKAKGIDVVVTDHHLPGERLPDCVIVNPKVASPAPFEGLCGAGVAFFLSNALVAKAREEGIYGGGKISPPLFVLAGLATVTDVMPLLAQNRVIVSAALKLFRSYAPTGLKELYARAAKTGVEAMSVRDFSFGLGPRINASGRMSNGHEALGLLLADDVEEAREFARKVDEKNLARKSVEQKMFDDAVKQLVKGASAQIIELPDGHKGVAGIVASRVLEHLAKEGEAPVPVAVVVGLHGSLRAPEGYNICEALSKSTQALERFGGHALAGGFTVKEGCMDLFRRLFPAASAEQAQSMAGGKSEGVAAIDAWISPEDLSLGFVESLEKMAPFGEGNPEPRFAFKGVRFSEVKAIGEGRHLALSLANSGGLRGVWWRNGDKVEHFRRNSASMFDVMFTPTVSNFGSERHVEINILAVGLSPGCCYVR